MNNYEVTLEYIGKRKRPQYTYTEYGFGTNPPICIRAKNITNAKKQLKLPSTVKIKKIKRV